MKGKKSERTPWTERQGVTTRGEDGTEKRKPRNGGHGSEVKYKKKPSREAMIDRHGPVLDASTPPPKSPGQDRGAKPF